MFTIRAGEGSWLCSGNGHCPFSLKGRGEVVNRIGNLGEGPGGIERLGIVKNVFRLKWLEEQDS